MTPFDHLLLERLLERGKITPDQRIVILKEHQSSPHRSIESILNDLGCLHALDILDEKALLTGYPAIDIRGKSLPKDLAMLNLSDLKTLAFFPFKKDDQGIHIGLHDPADIKHVDQIRRYLCPFVPMDPLLFYHVDERHMMAQIAGCCPVKDLNIDDNPLGILDHILKDSIKAGGSDIHFHPDDHHIQVRCRIDGIMQSLCVIHKSQFSQIANRLKVLAQLDITEQRRPQSGHFVYDGHGHMMNIRVSTHPTFFGENMVLRLLAQSKEVLNLTDLGFPKVIMDHLFAMAHAPQGMIIVTGPTGSGKTTTLYALLSSMNSQERNIMTLEAPIEALLPHIRQTEIKDNSVLSYADGIRSMLRQDPDVILIGEIRDEETAKMAIRAVLTGHLVLSTMHTTDTLGVPARFFDLGISPSMLAGTLHTVIAQRLVRKLCTVCKGKPSRDHRCVHCHDGFKGRLPLIEHMVYDEQANHIVAKGALRSELVDYRSKRCDLSLKDHGLMAIEQGLTTLEEVERVLGGFA